MPLRADRPELSGFGRFTPLRPLQGGHRNAVWLVAQGEVLWVAKSSARTEAALTWLQPLHRHARAAGFIVPQMAQTATGQHLCNGWTLEPFVAGRAATAADLATVQPRLQQMHRHAGKDAPQAGQRPGFTSARGFAAGAAQGGDVDMTTLPPALAARCRAAWAALEGEETLIHADITPGNLILTDQGPALIDWDEARRDLPLFDLPPADAPAHAARLAWEIACCWQAEPDHARALAQDWDRNCAETRR